MAIFSRRTIQRLLDENLLSLSAKQAERHIARLNAGGRDALSAEWEVATLNAFSKAGPLMHEDGVPGTTRPDIVFFSDNNKAKTLFIADITAVSDDSYHQDNPVEQFQEEMARVARKLGLTLAGFHLDIGASTKGPYRRAKVILSLPKKRDITAVMHARFVPFLQAVHRAPSQASALSVQVDSIDFIVRYNPNEKRFFSTHYQEYRSIYSLDRNVIVNCLREKASQLRKAQFEGIQGVILCDGNCVILQRGDGFGGPSYKLKDLIGHAFQKDLNLSFVLTITLRQESAMGSNRKPSIATNLYKNFNAKYPITDQCLAILQAAISHLPIAREYPVNASRRLNGKHTNIGVSFAGGCHMCGNQIKIPARSLLEILAGITGPGANPPADIFPNTLDSMCTSLALRKLQEGKTISRISLEHCPEEDDDWIVIQFGDADPAISLFRLLEPRDRQN